jgi:hypothetical protein
MQNNINIKWSQLTIQEQNSKKSAIKEMLKNFSGKINYFLFIVFKSH